MNHGDHNPGMNHGGGSSGGGMDHHMGMKVRECKLAWSWQGLTASQDVLELGL
jgi:hypothetical protein